MMYEYWRIFNVTNVPRDWSNKLFEKSDFIFCIYKPKQL